jgi:hypothetical protein
VLSILHPTYGIARLREAYRQDHPGLASPSIAAIARFLDSLHVTLKVARPLPLARNSPENCELRLAYASRVFQANDYERLVFMDEAGFTPTARHTFARSFEGCDAYTCTEQLRGSHINIIGAVSADMGLIHHEIVTSTVNGVRFGMFMTELKARLASSGPRIVVMDNASFHKTPTATASQDDTFRFLYLAPYSPSLNPIEYVWHIWISAVCRTLDGRCPAADEFVGAIENARADVTPAKCLACVKHTKEVLLDSVAKGGKLLGDKLVPLSV